MATLQAFLSFHSRAPKFPLPLLLPLLTPASQAKRRPSTGSQAFSLLKLCLDASYQICLVKCLYWGVLTLIERISPKIWPNQGPRMYKVHFRLMSVIVNIITVDRRHYHHIHCCFYLHDHCIPAHSRRTLILS